MKPNNFKDQPSDSVLQKTEAEIIARNIMVILERTGNTFRELSWAEYAKERKADGNFTSSEWKHFDKAVRYCTSEETAKLFSEHWGKSK